MSDALQWTVLPEAESLLEEFLNATERELVPTLSLCTGYSRFDRDRTKLEEFNGEHVGLGWFDAESVPDQHATIELLDRAVVVDPSFLSKANGKKLVLRTVEVGFPQPASKTKAVLFLE